MSISLRARLLATSCALLAGGASFGAAAAPNVGVTSAVVPAARGTPTEGNTRVLQVGLDMQANERIQTDADGKAHLLFLDGSALSIGPNSDVTLDEFVYDPERKTGKIALSATRGVFRLVGGQISKSTPVTLATPAATIGVRGGIAAITAGGEGVSAAFIYGVDMFVRAQERVERAERPGSLIQVPPGGAPLPAIPLTVEQANAQNSAFEGGPGQQSVGGPDVSDEDVAGSQISTLNSTSPFDVPPAAGGGAIDSAPFGKVAETASQRNQVDQSERQAEDALASFPVQGNYSGRLKRLDTDLLRTLDDAPGQNLGFSGAFSSSGFSGQAENGAPFVITPEALSELSFFGGVADPQPFGGGPLQAFFFPIFGDPEFLLVELFDSTGGVDDDFPFYFGFAGVPTPPAAIPTSGAGAWSLIDFFQDEGGPPFVPPGLGPAALNLPPQAYVTWNNSAPGASRSFLIPTLAISGQGLSQASTTSVVVGRLLNDGGGRPFLQSKLRGFSASPGDPASFFSGGISTSDGGDGSDFFGSGAPNYFVLEGSAADGSDAIVSRGVNVIGSSQPPHFPNVYASPTTYTPGARSTRTLNGFAAGAFAKFNTSGVFTEFGDFQNFLHGDVAVATDGSTNRVNVAFDLQTGDETSIDVRLGGTSDDGSSAFIDDRLFAAIDRPTSQTLVLGFNVASESSVLVTAQAVNLIDALPPGVSLCVCTHATWGFLSARLERGDGSRVEILNAPFVVGELSNAAQFNVTRTATYSGTVFGSVVRGVGPDSVVYTAFGNIQLGASFTPGSVSIGSVNVTNFDGGSLSGSGVGPANSGNNFTYQFSLTSSDIPGAGSVSATGRGAFVGPSGGPTTGPLTTIGAIAGDNGGPQDYTLRLNYFAAQ